MSRLKFFRQSLLDIRRTLNVPASAPEPKKWPADAITGSCLGHSTVLMNMLGVVVLTDPVFSTRVGIGLGPFVLGAKRYLRPALKIKQLPSPDVIVLSHAHFDHFDIPSLRRFDRLTPIVTADKTGDLLRKRGFKNVFEIAWGKSVQVSTARGMVSFTALRVAHWGARMLRDDYRGYNGYLIERAGHAICFAGDTAYTDAFSILRQQPHPIDLMIAPIGAYNPWIRAHCTPEQAATMADQAGARYFVPIHHQTFKLSSEPMDEPGQRIRAAFASAPERLLAVNVGETFTVPLHRTDFAGVSGSTNRSVVV